MIPDPIRPPGGGKIRKFRQMVALRSWRKAVRTIRFQYKRNRPEYRVGTPDD